MRDPLEIAQSWFRKAELETDQFDRFVSLWFAFNALYSEFFLQSERSAIRELVFSEQYQLPSRTLVTILSSQHTRFFTQRLIRDVRSGDRNTQEYASKLANEQNSLKYRLNCLLMILYQVRCNLFHGDKMYERDSDHEVVSAAAQALTAIVRAYLPSAGQPVDIAAQSRPSGGQD